MDAQSIFIIIITAVLIPTLVGIVILIIEYKTGYFNVRRRKELVVELVSLALLVTNTSGIHDKLQILFNGENVTSAFSAIVRIRNKGNVPITLDDFTTPIIIKFENNRVLDFSVTTNDNKLPLEIAIQSPEGSWVESKNEVAIKPLLLNEDEFFTLSIILEGWERGFAFNSEARIVGTKLSVEVIQPPKNISRDIKFLNIMLLIVLLSSVISLLLVFYIYRTFAF